MTPGRRPRRAALLAACAVGLPIASSALAQQPAAGAPASRFGQPGAPLDVSADGTEVFQAENKTVLTGRVEIVQGQSRMRAPRVVLFFNKNNGVRGQPAGAAAGLGPVNRMEADGPVYFVTPTQSAKGDHGVYEAESDTITLTGNVVVTQDKNVSTGDRLVIQQKTGQITMTGGPTSGRVRGVFYTKEKPPGAAGSPP